MLSISLLGEENMPTGWKRLIFWLVILFGIVQIAFVTYMAAAH